MQKQSLWYATGLGAILQEAERERAERVVPDLFGYHIVQVGAAGGCDFTTSSRIGHRVVLRFPDDEPPCCPAQLLGFAEELPLAADSVDVLILPHLLEFAASPHRLLREAGRVLIGGGHLLLFGFNPWSLWGAWRLLLAWRDEAPWCGHFYGLPRIRDWLSLLDLEVVTIDRFAFRPPLRAGRLMQRLVFLETVGHACWPILAGAYLVVARKHVPAVTPLRERRRASRSVLVPGVAEPTVRNGGHGL
jgi:SAM-dependent methyltransferase